MHHIHFETTDSTQEYLKQNISDLLAIDRDLIVTTDQQTAGVGRHGTRWSKYSNSLCFSFTLKPSESLTLTPLELGVLLSEFCQQKFNQKLQLKWPNDLILNQKQKCGGILCHYHSPEVLMIGIGLNLGQCTEKVDESQFKFKSASLLPQSSFDNTQLQELSLELFQYFLDNRKALSEIQEGWNQLCAHHQQLVEVVDGPQKSSGHFVGIGSDGQALIKDPETGHIKAVISGSLFY